MKQPLVTISIPTYNSEKTLQICLDSIKLQTYKNIEINIVDGNSSDSTVAIAKENNAHVYVYKGGLLGARYLGLKKARGQYILLLDSDQVLSPQTIDRAIKKISKDKLRMLVFEESVYKKENWIEKLFDLDRQLIHSVKDFDPYTGVMLPRFYEKKLLMDAFAAMPKNAIEKVGGQDHAIIYFEAWTIDKKIDLLTNAVKHMEPNSLRVIWKKFYRWGYTSKDARISRYNELLGKKEHFRKGVFSKGNIKSGAASILLLILKGVPYKIGMLSATLKKEKV